MLRAKGLIVVVFLSLMGTMGCTPTYPACRNDQDCNREKPRNEFCVNQQCQQCRNDGDCGVGKRCNKGRCDAIPGYCDDDSACPENTSCVEHRCTLCASDDQCGEGGHCRKGKCVRKGHCEVDEDCPPDQECHSGLCTGAPKKASQEAPCTLQPIYFDFNESVLSTEATDRIEKNAACVKQVGRMVKLVGRADPRGTQEYNLALSERRAEQVKDRMVRIGISTSLLRTLPKGDVEASGKDETGWANDRRVDFEWM